MIVDVVVVDSVTALPFGARGAVLVTGSHGGMIAAHYAHRAGVRAAVFNDAGRGLDDAGVAGVVALDGAGMAAAAVAHVSARIAQGSDTLERGVISFANRRAGTLGVLPGLACREAAERLRAATLPTGRLPVQQESRFVLAPGDRGGRAILGLDSIGGVVPGDAGCVLVIGSHGALHGGAPETALPVEAAGAIFHDAGGGRDGAGWSRLPVLDTRGIAAATAAHLSARIGDARSMWERGVLSRVNETAAGKGLRAGMTVRAAAVALAQASG